MRARVPAPAILPPENGIVVSARRPTDPEGTRWENGLAFDPQTCRYYALIDPCDVDTALLSSPPPDQVLYTPPAIVTGEDCTSLTRLPDPSDLVRRVRDGLEACTPRAIEEEIWRGTLARAAGFTDNWYLADEALTDNLSTQADPIPPVDALGCLEVALSRACRCGGRGMIHATADVVTHWTSHGLIRREGGLLLTVLNTIVVAGEGYDGSGPGSRGAGPTAAPTGATWAYATGRVDLRLEDTLVTPPEADVVAMLDRQVNDVQVFAQRRFAATHDGCCQFAVLIDVQSCLTGGS